MGIVHHSNYLRFCEEARVEWCKKKAALGDEIQAVFSLTVLETRVKHIKPARYSDQMKIRMQIRTEGVRLYFQYKISVDEQLIALAETAHCSLDLNFKVKRLDTKLIKIAEKELWTETWL
jgi:acyl-CoA thioester hydrolase